MKKFILVLFAIIALGIVTGCNNEVVLTLENTEVNLDVNDTYTIKPKVTGTTNFTLEYSVNDQEIVEVKDGIVKALKEGSAVITISIKEYKDVSSVEFKVIVSRKLQPSVVISGPNTVVERSEITLTALVTDTTESVVWTSSNDKVATVANGIVKGIKEGTAVITATCGEYSDSYGISVTKFEDLEAPMFILGEGYQGKVQLNWNKAFNPLQDITAVDNYDGDVTANIQVVNSFNNQEYGLHVIELSIEDSSGNLTTMTREVEVVWNYDVKFIGHAGSYYGIMNSEAAFLYAVSVLKYQALECDLKQTSDGVFVMSHDDTFADYTIASTPWSVLKDVEYTASRNSGFPSQNGSVTGSPYTTKLCTLERYLEICKEYNATAIIELKSSKGISSSDQSRMQALMDAVENAGMRENTILLGSTYTCLIWTRQNGYEDIPCQYLVNTFENEAVLQRCIEYDFDISINVTSTYSNNDEWFARYVDAGCKISVYTFTQYVDYPDVQTWIDKGVDFVTCDWHVMSKLNLPEGGKQPVPTYEVIFKDSDGTVLKTAIVKEGKTAAAPNNPSKNGYTFKGWDKDITNISHNLEVTAEYEMSNYTITYNANINVIVQTSWASKADFISEFYTDLYNWLLTNGKNVKEIVIDGNKVTMTKNGVTVTFTSVDELKAIDKYDFEKTISNIMYKPVVRGENDSCVIEASENYFLNSNAYREKYLALDAWFVKCINASYPAYDKTYTPTSAGKIQIMFRFQQWQQGTSIESFNKLPVKYNVTEDTEANCVLPTSKILYTVADEFDLPEATANYTFL